MPSAWIERRATKTGAIRHRVKYRLGGRESAHRYAGSFKAKRDAVARLAWVAGELAAMRVPNRRAVEVAPARAPTVAEACERWRAARVDVVEGTRVLHRVALGRVVPILGDRLLDELTVDDVNELVRELASTGRKRETIRKSVKYLAAVLEENGVDPNPARSKRVRLPHEEPIELEPPTAEHVEAVLRLLPHSYRLPRRFPFYVDHAADFRARTDRAEKAAGGSGRDGRYPSGMVELRVVVSDELAEQLAEQARREHTTPEQLASRAVQSLYGRNGDTEQGQPGFVALGSSGRSDISERSEEILRAELGA